MRYLHPFVVLALFGPIVALGCSSSLDDTGSGTNAVGGSQATPAGTSGGGATPSSPGATPSPAGLITSNGFEVIFVGSQTNADGTSTWRYRVTEMPCAQDLSNWVLEVFDCAIVSASPQSNEFVHPDPNANLTGVKWETGGSFSSGEFAVTVSGPARADTVRFGVKGPEVVIGETTGPRCGDAAAPPVNPRVGSRGNHRCPDASVPPNDAAPPPPPPPSVDAGSDGSVCTMICAEDVPCPANFQCNQGCCQPVTP